MTTSNRTFSVRNGIDVANTLIVSNTSGVINVSNITLINAVSGNITSEGIYANGTAVIRGVANLNFNNTATINIAAGSNGIYQSNISFSVNTSAINGLLV